MFLELKSFVYKGVDLLRRTRRSGFGNDLRFDRSDDRVSDPIPVWRFLLYGILILLVLGVWLIQSQTAFDFSDLLRGFGRVIEESGPYSVFIFILGCAAAVVFLFWLPVWPFFIFSGLAFGFLPGLIYSLFGSFLGAIGSFLLIRRLSGRYLRNNFIEMWRHRLERYYCNLGPNEFSIVLIIRLLYPLLPFRSLNYAFGLTDISFKSFCTGTAIGIVPSTALFVYLGSAVSTWQPGYMFLAIILSLTLSFLVYWFYRRKVV